VGKPQSKSALIRAFSYGQSENIDILYIYIFFLLGLRLRVLSVRSRYFGADRTTHLYIFEVFVTFGLFIKKKASILLALIYQPRHIWYG
jgi:hypothetical protein